ncbi:MAG TPA: NADH-quinone oxidoreductase subunit C, partial [Actinomycetota bacterium]
RKTSGRSGVASSPPLPARDLIDRLRAQLGDDLTESSDQHGQAAIGVPPARYRETIEWLRDDDELAFDFFDFLTAVDRGDEGFDVVVQLWSTSRRHQARVKVRLPREDPRLPSIHDLFRGADWYERETWELFGIDFEGHPGLVKLVLPEEFEGHPGRKDFPLATRIAKPWPGDEQIGEAEE